MKEKSKVVRNGQIDFWRFIGISMIVIGHSNKLLDTPPLQNVFAIWVDFFFIVTGFFVASFAPFSGDAFVITKDTITVACATFTNHKGPAMSTIQCCC